MHFLKDLKAEVFRDGKHYMQEYQKGKASYPVKEIGDSDYRGTQVIFQPDDSIFETVEFNYDTLATRLRELSFLNKGLRLTLTDERTPNEKGEHPTEEFISERGLQEFVEYIDSTREQLMSQVIHITGEKNGVPVEVAMTYNTSFNENIHSYVNNINTHEGGTHLSGFRRGLTNTLIYFLKFQVCWIN